MARVARRTKATATQRANDRMRKVMAIFNRKRHADNIDNPLPHDLSVDLHPSVNDVGFLLRQAVIDLFRLFAPRSYPTQRRGLLRANRMNTHNFAKARKAVEAEHRRRAFNAEFEIFCSGGAIAIAGLLIAVTYCLLAHQLMA